MKTWFYLIALIVGIVIGALFVHSCEMEHGNEEVELVKDSSPDSTLITGKSDSTFTMANENIRWIKEDCHKKHYPAKRRIVYIDSNGVQEPVVKRFQADTFTIGRASIYLEDTIQGELVSRKLGCKGCDPDTLRITRTDTLQIVETDTLNMVKSVLFSDGLQVTVGFPVLPWLVVGYGGQFNLRGLFKKKVKRDKW